MRYAFYFTTTANARGVFFLVLWNLKAHALVFYYVLAILYLLALSYRFITLFYFALYSLYASLMLQMFGLRYIDFFLINWIKEGSFYYDAPCDPPYCILEKMFMNYGFCFVKNNIKLAFWIHLFQRRFIFHISFQKL